MNMNAILMKLHRLAIFAITAFLVTGIVYPIMVLAQDDIRKELVQFKKGTSGATIKDRIKGREVIDYTLGAKAGQRMTVNFDTDNTANYFNILTPGETDIAFFIGSTEGMRYEGNLPETGDYTIRVYLMRSAARRNETANYSLEVAIAAAADPPSETNHPSGNPNESGALVSGTEFNATGEIPCARVAGQPMGSCRFGVRRERGGSGAITVFWPDGGNRVILFEDGAPSSYDESEADGGAEMTVERKSDLFMVRIGDQRFEFPEAVISGG